MFTLDPIIQGPPFLSGDLHVGHGINLVIKDFLIRDQYRKTGVLQDFPYNFDAQGLPTENEVLKDLDFYTNYRTSEHIDRCLTHTRRTRATMVQVIKKLNMAVPPVKINSTTDVAYKISLMNFVADLYEAGSIYKDLRHVNYCYYCNNTVANAQVEERVIESKVYFVKVRLTNAPYTKETNLIFATTEPETVLQNEAVCVNPNCDYYVYQSDKDVVITGLKDQRLFLQDYDLKKRIKGIDLQHTNYLLTQNDGNVIKAGTIECADFVHYHDDSTVTDNTTPYLGQVACVSLSPWGGVVDFKHVLSTRDASYVYMNIEQKRDERSRLVRNLSSTIKRVPVVYTTTYNKRYDSCWRCKKRLGVAFIEQYFLRIGSETRSTLVSQLENSNYNDPGLKCATVKYGSNPVDWAISRSRAFGTPMPLLVCKNPKCSSLNKEKVARYTRHDVLNQNELFPTNISTVISRKAKTDSYYRCICGNVLDPVNYTLDVWIDSGFLPLYLGEKFTMVEGIDQIRGWVYSSSVLSVLKNQTAPFKSMAYIGWILSRGQKLSKSNANRLHNLCQVLDRVDIDEFRSFAVSKASADNSEFSVELIQQQKKYVNVVRNVCKFLSHVDFKNYDVRDMSPVFTSTYCANEWSKLQTFLGTLDSYYAQLKFSRYWMDLKNHFLTYYSRVLINQHKKHMDDEVRKLILLYGYQLLKRVRPVMPKAVQSCNFELDRQSSA